MLFHSYLINMPIVTVSLFGGRTQTEKDRLAEAITEDVTRILKVQKKEVVVVFEEAPHGNWYSAGVRI
jgi:4-oxalocrotonate tautomerase